MVVLNGKIKTKFRSKGIRTAQAIRAQKIIKLRNEGKSWTWIGDILDMDKSNVRRTYIKHATPSPKALR